MKSDYSDTITCCINLKGPKMDLIVRPKLSVLRTDVRERIAAATSPSVTRYKGLWGLWRGELASEEFETCLGWTVGYGLRACASFVKENNGQSTRLFPYA